MKETTTNPYNWRLPTSQPLLMRWNPSENCFEVDWETSREEQRQQANREAAARLAEKVKSREMAFYEAFLSGDFTDFVEPK